MSSSEAKFKINVREGSVELEGTTQFVDKHLEKFEEIFKMAIKEAVTSELRTNYVSEQKSLASNDQEMYNSGTGIGGVKHTQHGIKHSQKTSITISPIPVDLKSSPSKIGLRELYSEKRPTNHYEKCTLFVYYLNKYNSEDEVKYGEILSCYEEVNEKKPSIIDIIKNSIRYKGWLEPGREKYSTKLTISGENYIKFDLPSGSNI